MSDQGFHEIQLSGKQLVFLFMSLLVLAVVVFLLGVSVGRGVRLAVPSAPRASVDAGAPGDTSVPATMPPPTQTSPNELDYHERLQGRGASEPPKVAEPPSPPTEAPPQASSTQPAGAAPQTSASKTPAAPARGGADTPKTTTPPAAAGNAAKPAPVSPAPAAGAWSVQVEAFRSKELADNLVAKLKGKGYAAFVFNSAPPGVPYHVRIGPFAQRDDAVRTQDRLKKEGFTPSVIR